VIQKGTQICTAKNNIFKTIKRIKRKKPAPVDQLCLCFFCSMKLKKMKKKKKWSLFSMTMYKLYVGQIDSVLKEKRKGTKNGDAQTVNK